MAETISRPSLAQLQKLHANVTRKLERQQQAIELTKQEVAAYADLIRQRINEEAGVKPTK